MRVWAIITLVFFAIGLVLGFLTIKPASELDEFRASVQASRG